ncbi:hypothetical protein [Aquabacterium sp. OR-4]|uniref:hypothetical protein n=1 Tax=Aquabacterium sp. OR-4 TaxID=2978127 RepID=UPI0021B3C18B|nr:hypothetical protein [Aquabacterium sp. OR-4]MDT7837910.1 hypothetical protein [Aquabacterium sp. OR-4]
MNTHTALGAALALLLASTTAQADTLINIKGHGSDGAGTVLPLSYPLAVGSVIELDKPVLLDLLPGRYSLVNAWGMPGALYDTWNFEVPQPGSWGSHYVVAEQLPSGRFSVLVDGQSLTEPTCRNHFCAWDTRAQATAAFLATPAYTFTLKHAATVGFVAADYFLPDNDGGISLLLTAAPVPEPATLALWLAALPLLRRPLRGLRPVR